MTDNGKKNILISLYRGYGLGDAVQMSAVLRHVAKYRPKWEVDYQAEEGKHQCGRGIVVRTFAYGTKYPTQRYDAEVQICLYDTWANWGDRPNTRVSSCLRERFDLDWDRECGRYRVDVDQESINAAQAILYGCVQKDQRGAARLEVGAPRNQLASNRFVAVHYEGDSSKPKKDLTHSQAEDVCRAVLECGRIPLVLDWRATSPLPHRRLRVPRDWGADAQMVCAVIGQCEAFVGIDSGPSKCASATDTPALVTWTGHHPAPFHDPAPNTTHLVPRGYHGLEPVCGNRGVIDWFEANYQVWEYAPGDPVPVIKQWLKERLK
jgi:hypothetical protein